MRSLRANVRVTLSAARSYSTAQDAGTPPARHHSQGVTKMHRFHRSVLAASFALSGAVHAAQVCTLGAASAGAQGTLLCYDSATGASTQSIALGNTVTGKGGTGGTLSRSGDTVL